MTIKEIFCSVAVPSIETPAATPPAAAAVANPEADDQRVPTIQSKNSSILIHLNISINNKEEKE